MADPIRFLVVDDEPLAVERLQLLLARMEGVALAGTASDGAAALRLVEAVEPDAVLLDIAMPGMDGIDVARALARAAKPPVVIFVTAFDTFAVAAFDVEAVDYVMKPVSAERLARAVERARERLAGARRSRAGRGAAARSSSRNSGYPRPAAWSASPPRTSTGSAPSAIICGSMSARGAG